MRLPLKFRHWSLVIVHWTFVLGLCAQDAPQPVALRFLFLDESPGAYSIRIGSDYRDLGPTPYVISAPQELAPGARLQLYKELPDPATGRPVRTRVLDRTAPPGLPHALVVVAPSSSVAEDGTRSYTARFYDTDPARTPPQSIRILNLSSVPMAARFGADEAAVAPGESKTIQPAPDARGRLRTFIGVNVQGPEGWRIIYNSFVSLRQNQRMTGILVYSPSGLRHTYSEDELIAMGPPQPGHFWLSFTETTRS